jgi:hypothetical protein
MRGREENGRDEKKGGRWIIRDNGGRKDSIKNQNTEPKKAITKTPTYLKNYLHHTIIYIIKTNQVRAYVPLMSFSWLP